MKIFLRMKDDFILALFIPFYYLLKKNQAIRPVLIIALDGKPTKKGRAKLSLRSPLLRELLALLHFIQIALIVFDHS